MAYTVHQAKTQFSRLLKEAEAGKEVIVLRGKKPVAKLVALGNEPSSAAKRGLAGRYEGLVFAPDDAFDPLTDQELADLGFTDLLPGDLVPPAS